MKIVGERLRSLRDSLNVSQEKMAQLIGSTQSSINRYEQGLSSSIDVLLKYADFFDVSMDYICGRTDNPQGKMYQYLPNTLREKMESNSEIKQFVEMCFDPGSPMNERLKNALYEMLAEDIK